MNEAPEQVGASEDKPSPKKGFLQRFSRRVLVPLGLATAIAGTGIAIQNGDQHTDIESTPPPSGQIEPTWTPTGGIDDQPGIATPDPNLPIKTNEPLPTATESPTPTWTPTGGIDEQPGIVTPDPNLPIKTNEPLPTK